MVIDIIGFIAFICGKARVMFCVIKLGHYVIVDVGGKHVMPHTVNVHIKIKKINSSLHCELGQPVLRSPS